MLSAHILKEAVGLYYISYTSYCFCITLAGMTKANVRANNIPALWHRLAFAGFSHCKIAYTKVSSLISKAKSKTSYMMCQIRYVWKIMIYIYILMRSDTVYLNASIIKYC